MVEIRQRPRKLPLSSSWFVPLPRSGTSRETTPNYRHHVTHTEAAYDALCTRQASWARVEFKFSVFHVPCFMFHIRYSRDRTRLFVHSHDLESISSLRYWKSIERRRTMVTSASARETARPRVRYEPSFQRITLGRNKTQGKSASSQVGDLSAVAGGTVSTAVEMT